MLTPVLLVKRGIAPRNSSILAGTGRPNASRNKTKYRPADTKGGAESGPVTRTFEPRRDGAPLKHFLKKY
jgi:hypothetical protein